MSSVESRRKCMYDSCLQWIGDFSGYIYLLEPNLRGTASKVVDARYPLSPNATNGLQGEYLELGTVSVIDHVVGNFPQGSQQSCSCSLR